MMDQFKAFTTNWKTTGAALGALLTVLGPALSALTDGDAATNPDWNVVIPVVVMSLGVLFSRDQDKSSEASGVGAGK